MFPFPELNDTFESFKKAVNLHEILSIVLIEYIYDIVLFKSVHNFVIPEEGNLFWIWTLIDEH